MDPSRTQCSVGQREQLSNSALYFACMFWLDLISYVSREDGAALACPRNGVQYALRHLVQNLPC